MNEKLKAKLDAEYNHYYSLANRRKLAMVWSYEEWLEHSVVAAGIIKEGYSPGDGK